MFSLKKERMLIEVSIGRWPARVLKLRIIYAPYGHVREN